MRRDRGRLGCATHVRLVSVLAFACVSHFAPAVAQKAVSDPSTARTLVDGLTGTTPLGVNESSLFFVDDVAVKEQEIDGSLVASHHVTGFSSVPKGGGAKQRLVVLPGVPSRGDVIVVGPMAVVSGSTSLYLVNLENKAVREVGKTNAMHGAPSICSPFVCWVENRNSQSRLLRIKLPEAGSSEPELLWHTDDALVKLSASFVRDR